MKRGNTGFAVLIIVAVVLGLGLAFVFSSNSSPTGYTGAVVLAPSNCAQSCLTSSECLGAFENDCCDSGQSAACSFGECVCVNSCEESENCDPDAENGETQCGGIVGETAKSCQPTDPNGENGGCDCDMNGCTEGACSTFGVAGVPFVNPCGPNGHCEPTGGEDGTLFGQCVCGPKACEFTEDEDKDQCSGTVKCDEGSSCTKSSQCGGPGVGACEGGKCDCDCVSWAPCRPSFEDEDCGPAGDCITGPDGAFECMCASEFGCSFDQCEPGKTPCDDSEDCFGGSCQTTDGVGVCEKCGIECDFNCDENENGSCPDPETEADCDAVGEALGGAECQLDDSCECRVPEGVCDPSLDCIDVNGLDWCVEE